MADPIDEHKGKHVGESQGLFITRTRLTLQTIDISYGPGSKKGNQSHDSKDDKIPPIYRCCREVDEVLIDGSLRTERVNGNKLMAESNSQAIRFAGRQLLS